MSDTPEAATSRRTSDREPLPSKLVRRVSIALVTVALVIGVLLFVIPSGDDADITVTNNVAIDDIVPARGAEVLQQTDVAIDLAAGYDASLSVNGIPIPEAQLQRTEVLNRLSFRPDAGRVIEALDPDRNCATAVYWPVSNPTDTSSITWCFTAA